jgi:uracil-DNA glycosylase family 4
MTAADRPGVLGDEAHAVTCAGLPALEAHIGDCQRCPLGATRTRPVFGVGDPKSKLMFIGEAPGRNEDLKGEPFVGAAGKLLDELLASIGLERSQVYIANVLKCRPPSNRDPQPVEIETCTPFLAEQVRLVDPVVIATLGNFATKYILGTATGITQLRGKLYRVDGRQIVPIYHPAAALYSPDKREYLLEDFARLRTVLDRTTEVGSQPPGPSGGADVSMTPEQEALF